MIIQHFSYMLQRSRKLGFHKVGIMQKFRGGAYCKKYGLKSDSRQVGTGKELPFQLISTKPSLDAGFVKYKVL
jgi:hypothetical protein